MTQMSQTARTKDDGRGDGQTRMGHPQITQITQIVFRHPKQATRNDVR